jgi:hypothetical protein
MNDVLCPFLHRFVLIFFDDILIYNKSWVDHLRHLRAILSTSSSCAFGVASVAYLGHMILEAGMAMDPTKV